MTCFSKKAIKYFIFQICAGFQTQKKKRLDVTCVFECFQSHCHILKELYKIWHIMGAIIIFGESIFIFNFVIMEW
jgi:hypothetical protein